MPRAPHQPPALRGAVFLARSVLDAGLVTRDDLRTRAWRHLFQGVYADSSVRVTHRLRCAAVDAFLLPDTGVIAGRSAAVLHRVGLAKPDDPVEVLVPLSAMTGRRRGVLVHRGELAEDERQVIAGMAVTTPVRTCWDLARWLDPVEAVALIDRMLGRGRVCIPELAAYLARRRAESPTPRGWRRFARVVPLVNGAAESPQESRLRVRLVIAGLPMPQVQFAVLSSGGEFIARVDLAWPEFRLALEYDGLWHVGSAAQMHQDRRRLNALVGEGWTVLHVTSARLRDEFDAVVAEIRAAMRRTRTPRSQF